MGEMVHNYLSSRQRELSIHFNHRLMREVSNRFSVYAINEYNHAGYFIRCVDNRQSGTLPANPKWRIEIRDINPFYPPSILAPLYLG